MKKQCIFLLPLLLMFVTACQSRTARTIIALNPIPMARPQETISLDWQTIQRSVPGLTAENAAVRDLKTDQLLPVQIIEGQGLDTLLFQADFAPGEKKEFVVLKRPAGVAAPLPEYTTYCRFIPERKDDFGWENDKVAFRMYGPALEYETITCGIDAWGKCVPYPVIDKFIRNYVEKDIPYHYDHGEGGDFYKVGNTLGCGGMAPFAGGKVCLPPHNFADWKILANGPIRSVFELTYRPWQAGPYTVSETKRISIDLGSNLSRIECRYTCDDDTLPLAAGIILRETSDQTWTGRKSIAYWLPTDFIEGHMGCGVVFGPEYDVRLRKADGHLLLTLNQPAEKPVVYYAGSCWDKNTEFDSFEKWQRYLAAFKQRLDNPIVIQIN